MSFKRKLKRKAHREKENYIPDYIFVHGTMMYRCSHCGWQWEMYLEKGLGNEIQDSLYPEKHKLVPVFIECPICGCPAQHIGNDTSFGIYRRIDASMNDCFRNYANEDCGVPKCKNYFYRKTRQEAEE